MWQFIVSHLADIFMVLCGIFAGAAIIVLEVAIGTVIEKGYSFPSAVYLLRSGS